MYEQNLFQDEALFHYGLFLLNQNRFPEAEKQFREIGKVLPKSYWHGYGMALFFAKKGDKTAALDWLEKFLDNFFPDENMILEEPLFSKIRKTKLMLKHFKK